MRYTLILLLTLIKDCKATVDWHLHGDGMLEAMEAISQAARGTQGSATRQEGSG
jgi:hypothetical protein